MPLAPPWTAEAAAGPSLHCLKQIGGDPTSLAVVPSPAEPFLPNDHAACTCSHFPSLCLPWLCHPPRKTQRLSLRAFYQREPQVQRYGIVKQPLVSREHPGVRPSGLNGKSPARLVYMTLKECIWGMCFAVVKCFTDANFYDDVYHRVVVRPK